jgi:AcrR family transcriptional regulator
MADPIADNGPARRRDSYHHGDLRNALIDAATELARAGGPEAVVLREAARHVGVSATAAYRHFASHADLVAAVKERALGFLAESMRADLAGLEPTGDAQVDATNRLCTLGRAYVQFALRHTGLFRTAFFRREGDPIEDKTPGPTDTAYDLLATAVDDLVSAGVVPAQRRPHTETAAWASVHGLSVLLLDGPLRAMPESEREAALNRMLQVVVHGL